MQPGDSRGLEGSSAGAGEAAGPCSPSVSFSSVDMRVLSPLRELVSAWGRGGKGTDCIALTVPLPHLPRRATFVKQDAHSLPPCRGSGSEGGGGLQAAFLLPPQSHQALETFVAPQNCSYVACSLRLSYPIEHSTQNWFGIGDISQENSKARQSSLVSL